MEDISGKTCIITGASSGIGRASAYALADQGVNLVLTARREERLKEICNECIKKGVKAVYYAGDAVKESTAEAVVKLALDTFGSIDMLLSNAGIGMYKPFLETTMEDYDRIMDTNVRSSYAFLLHTIPEMIRNGGGQIIIVSSVTGMIGAANETAYTATKFASRGIAQSLNKEFRTSGIRVTCLEPSCTYTEFEIGNGRTKEEMEKKKETTLSAEDLAEAVVYTFTRRKGIRVMEMYLAGMQGD